MEQCPDLIMVLLGNTGVGKSASGNMILGTKAFESRLAFSGVTKEISKQTAVVYGKRISVVDTPGILESEDEIKSWCESLQQTSVPCLFLVVVKIDRFSDEQKKALEAAERVIGDQKFNSYLLFTRGDYLSNMSLDDFINQDPAGPLRPIVQGFGGRQHVFNNENGGPEQVRELLEKSGYLKDVPHPKIKRKMALLGLPGGGKSASGNTILGSEVFQSSAGFNAISTETVSKSATVEGRQVTVMDTPGLTDKTLSPKRLYRELMKSVFIDAGEVGGEAGDWGEGGASDEGGGGGGGTHAFIIVVELSRVLPPQEKMCKLLHMLFGEHAKKYSMVLFTHGDKLKGQTIERFIKANRFIKKLVESCGRRYCVFDNTKIGNREQVRKLLDQIDEMVESNGGQPYTSDMLTMPLSQDRDTLPEIGKTLSKVGSALPKGGKAFPKDGKALPKGGKAFPKDGKALPKGGKAFPKDGKALPKGGKDFPGGGKPPPQKRNWLEIIWETVQEWFTRLIQYIRYFFT